MVITLMIWFISVIYYENKLRDVLKLFNFDELPSGLFIELKYETKINKNLNNVESEDLEVEENQIVNSETLSIEELSKKINVTKQTLLSWKITKPQLIELIYLGLEIENIRSKTLGAEK